MATNLSIRGIQVKQRNPAGVIGLTFITAGIYLLYWYYQLNRELRDLGEDVSPGISVLAITFGIVLIVPPYVSLYNTGERLKRQGQAAGVASNISGAFLIVMMLLSFLVVPYIVMVVKMQGHANEIYARCASVGGPSTLTSAEPSALAWPEQPASAPAASDPSVDTTGQADRSQ